MRKLLAATASAFLLAGAANAATIVNLHAQNNASMDGSNAVIQFFTAGTYEVTFVQDEFTAFSRWKSTSGCDSAGESCRRGWENSAIIALSADEADAIFFGDGGATGGYAPVDGEPWLYFETAEQSLVHAAVHKVRFTLGADQDVGFFIGDSPANDNRGGVSLSIEAVPEPATWAMLITGFGMVGLGVRRRKSVAASVAN